MHVSSDISGLLHRINQWQIQRGGDEWDESIHQCIHFLPVKILLVILKCGLFNVVKTTEATMQIKYFKKCCYYNILLQTVTTRRNLLTQNA